MKRAGVVIMAMLTAGCGAPETSRLSGYVEADMLYMAAQEPGVVAQIAVREGDRVEKGGALFSLDVERLSIAADQADAGAAAVARRVEAAGVLDQAVAEAEAELDRVTKNLRRTVPLLRDGFVSQARYDNDKALVDEAAARLERAKAERDAVNEELKSAQAQAALARRRLDDLAVQAPDAGTVERIYRRAGEVVAAGEPVLALLPPSNVKLKFFAPEPKLAQLSPGGEIAFSCDGCAEGMKARISYIATEPQFTPPVIYSLEERTKLVFLVEARPETPEGLRPGLPVTIDLP